MLDLTRLFPVSVSVSDQYRCFTGDNLPIGTGTVVSGGSSANYQEECELHDANFDPNAVDGEGPNNGTDSSGLPWSGLFSPTTDPEGNGNSTTAPIEPPSQSTLPSDPFDPEWFG